MHGTSQSWQISIIGFVMAMIAVLFGLAVFTENRQQLTANQAVQAALYDAEVKGDATSKGLYVINKDRFEKDLTVKHPDTSPVSHWRDFNKKYSDVKIKTYYMYETNKYAKNYEALNKNNKSFSKYVPLKAVKILVTGVDTGEKHPKSKNGRRTLDIVTYVANVRVNDRSDDVYLYQTSDDYKKGSKGDPYYEYNNDLEHKKQENKLASKKRSHETDADQYTPSYKLINQ